MKISKLKPGDVAYTITKGKMGNTTINTVYVHSVDIHEVNEEKGYVIASWNSNKAKKYYEAAVAKWKKSEPVLIYSNSGAARLATKEEKAEILAKKKEEKTTL